MNERTPLPFYANEAAIRDIQSRFSYIFKPATEGGGKPYVRLIPCERFTPEYPLCIGGVEVVHIPLQHGSLAVAGWVLSEYRSDAKGGTAKSDASPAATKHSIAYLTDCNAISDTSIDCIRRASGVLEHVVLDGLRESTHSTHFSFDEAFECAQKIGAAHTWITHICHDKNHEEITAYFEKKMEAAQHDALQNGHRNAHCTQVCPAYDGLKLNV
jgi:phosphoribosyl 1,2-cyclic phosphate phosphodiesterase